jgi:hypothetical protein
MTHRVFTREFVVPTVVAIVLGITLAICTAYLTEVYLGPIDQAEGDYAVTGSH